MSRRSPGSRRSSRRSARSRTSPGSMSPVVPRPPLRAAEEHDRRVQGARLHVRRAAVRHRRVHEQRDRRDQEPDRVHGRLPADDRQRHVHHQRHRAGRRLAARPLARASTSSAPSTRPPTRTSSPPRSSRRAVPGSSSRSTSSDMVGVRLDRKRKQSVTVLLKALGWDDAQILEEFGQYESIRLTLEKDHTTGQDDALLDIYRKLRPGEPPTKEAAQTLLDNLLLQPQALRPGQGRSLQGQQEARARACRSTQGTLTIDDIVAAIHYIVALHAGETELRAVDARASPSRRGRRHRPLRQPAPAHGRRADPEPGPHRPGPDGAGRPRADDDPGRRGDHAADPDQHPPGGGLHQGVLRHQPAVAVHGPDQPARRSDPQAPAVGARPRWPVP